LYFVSMFIRAFMLVPLLLLVAWGSAAATSLQPELVGVAISTLWVSALVFGYALMLWWWRYWRVSSANRGPSAVQLALLLSFVCFAVFEWYTMITCVAAQPLFFFFLWGWWELLFASVFVCACVRMFALAASLWQVLLLLLLCVAVSLTARNLLAVAVCVCVWVMDAPGIDLSPACRGSSWASTWCRSST